MISISRKIALNRTPQVWQIYPLGIHFPQCHVLSINRPQIYNLPNTTLEPYLGIEAGITGTNHNLCRLDPHPNAANRSSHKSIASEIGIWLLVNPI